MKRITILFYLVLFVSCQSQNSISSKYAETIKQKDLFGYLSVLASDSLEGREAGTEGQLNAANFIMHNFEDFGLLPWIKTGDKKSYFQEFKMHNRGIKKPFNLPMFLNRDNEVNKKNLPDYINTQNVIGYIKGSEKENEYIIISAHYDHLGKHGGMIFNGADDNASGTSALLEIAEAFSISVKNNNPPKRSIIFAAFTAEEKGLIGSKYFMEYRTIEPVKIAANLNIDMVGRNGDDFVNVIGASVITPELEEVIEKVNDMYVDIRLDYSLDDGSAPSSLYKRSDQYNFARFGIPAVFFYGGYHSDYHRSTDTIDKINFTGLEKRTKLIFYTAWELANMENRIGNNSN